MGLKVLLASSVRCKPLSCSSLVLGDSYAIAHVDIKIREALKQLLKT